LIQGGSEEEPKRSLSGDNLSKCRAKGEKGAILLQFPIFSGIKAKNTDGGLPKWQDNLFLCL
jgi:hypothetical protein